MQRILGAIGEVRRGEIVHDLDQAAAVSRDYVLLVVLSCVIATFGLVLNSGAVIIGAMLIAPLMSSILGFALALVRGDSARAGRALGTLGLGASAAVALSATLGQLVSAGELNFLEELPSEILARTEPTLFDLVVALAGGAAAAYALAQPHLSATLPGVAIATALMPPLCVVGIGVSQGRADVAGGALLLFLANFVAIVFASSLVFAGVGFGPLNPAGSSRALSRPLLLSAALLLLVTVPLGLFMAQIVRDARENDVIRTTLVEGLSQVGDSSLASFGKQRSAGGVLAVTATIRSPRSLTHAEANEVQRRLAGDLEAPVALKLLVVPVTRLDPLVPPTRTPTPPAGATPTPTQTVTQTPTTTPVPPPASPSPSATPSVTVTPSPTSSTTPSPAPTVPSPTPTVSPPPTATAVTYSVVGATDREGANLRRTPGLGAVVEGVPDGVVVQLTGRRAEGDEHLWAEVVLPDGRSGWVAAVYLVPYHRYRNP